MKDRNCAGILCKYGRIRIGKSKVRHGRAGVEAVFYVGRKDKMLELVSLSRQKLFQNIIFFFNFKGYVYKGLLVLSLTA